MLIGKISSRATDRFKKELPVLKGDLALWFIDFSSTECVSASSGTAITYSKDLVNSGGFSCSSTTWTSSSLGGHYVAVNNITMVPSYEFKSKWPGAVNAKPSTFSTFNWFYINNATSTILSIGQGGPTYGFSLMEIAANVVKYGMWNTSNTYVTASTPAVTLGSWYHIGFTCDGSKITGYLNGVQVATSSNFTPSPAWNSTLLITPYYASLPGISKFPIVAGNTGNMTTSRAGSLAAWRVALTSDDVRTLFDSTRTKYGIVSNDGLMLNYEIGNSGSYVSASGTTITDMKAGSNSTLQNTPIYNVGTTNYLTFNGTTQAAYTTASLSNYFSGSSPTKSTIQSIFMWVYPFTSGNILVERGASGSTDGTWYNSVIDIDWQGKFYFGNYNGTTLPNVSSSKGFNSWYYVGYTYDGATLTGYVNGQSVGSTSFARSAPYNNGANLFYSIAAKTATNMLGTTGSFCSMSFGGMQMYSSSLDPQTIQTNFFATRQKYGLNTSGKTYGFRYYRFYITKNRNSGVDGYTQLAEFVLIANGYRVDYSAATATNPGGNNPVGEEPSKAIDNNTSTKCVDLNLVTNGYSSLVVDFGTTVNADSFYYTTANDFNSRDPVRWLVQGSSDNSTWTTVHDQSASDATITTTRFANTQTFLFT